MIETVESVSDPVPLADAGAASPTDGESASETYSFAHEVFCLSRPDSPEAESIRSLRAHLMAGHVRDGRRALAICSPSRGTGCSTVAVNLAVAFAQSGVNTLLVDANLREPGLQNFITPATPQSGLYQMLAADADMRTDEIRRDVRPNLSLLYAGSHGRKAAEMIAKREFKDVIDDCMRGFELMIVDTPIEGGTADARRVATTVRYGLVVARRNVTLVSSIKAFVEELEGDRVRLLGAFITDF